MKLVIQRVSEASVTVEEERIAAIGKGLLVLICVEKGDDTGIAEQFSRKVAELRIFPDDAGKMNRSVLETGGEILVVSQFTLAGNIEKGRRPSFESAADPKTAEELYGVFTNGLKQLGVPVKTGVFRAFMKVGLVNDGPVTIILDRRVV